MRRLHTLTLPTLLMTMLTAGMAHAAPWKEDEDFSALENALAPSYKVDAADLNGDGAIDLVFANTDGSDKGTPASTRPQQVYFNDGFGTFTDATDAVYGAGVEYTGRTIKLRDIDDDGDNDIILGTVWITQSQLLLNDGNGNFTNVTATNLPARPANVGDLEVGDVDQDGALDIVLSNWGEDETQDDDVNSNSAGGTTLLWMQTGPGTAIFSDATAMNMPPDELRMSWDLEFIDVDNDYALDILITCQYCAASESLWLLRNDGLGGFAGGVSNISSPNDLFADSNDVEVIDLNGDTFLDAVVLHDGINARNRVLTNDAGNGFTVTTDANWPTIENPKSQDFMAAFYDYDSDKDPDLVIGALKTADMMNPSPDRLMENEVGAFKAWGPMNVPKNQALEETTKASLGTTAIVLADFNGDFKLDVAMASADNAPEKYVYMATDEVAPDTAAPIIPNYEKVPDPLNFPDDSPVTVRLRSHDNKSPLMIHDFQADGVPYLESWTVDPNPDPDANPGLKTPGRWYGEYLWTISFDVPDADEFWWRYCAIDAAGNKACTPLEKSDIIGGGETTTSDTNTATESDTANTNTISDSDTSNSNSISDSMTETDSITDSGPTDSMTNTMSESMSDSQPTDSFGSNSMTETDSNSNSNSNSDTETDSNSASDTSNQLDDDGCGCNTDDGPSGALAALALLSLLGIRRRRR
jgi:MYXO-CTERM domain-containing protein